MTTTRWPFDNDAPHDDGNFTCHCQDCRNKRAAGMKRWARAVRRDNERHMVDPDHTRDRKR